MPGAHLRAMQALAAEVWHRRPDLLNVDASVGELAWVFGRGEPKWEIWRDREGDDALAWAYLDGDSLVWQVHPDRLDLLPEVLRSRPFATTNARTGFDLEPFDLVAAPDEPWHHLTTRKLVDLEPPTLPDGFRHVTMASNDDVAGFVAAHVAAWEGSTLTVGAYLRLMRTWPYRADLDVAVQADDGAIVGRAIVWLDDENGTAELEPVGVVPSHRGLGLAPAMLRFAMQRARDEGATTMVVGCRGDDAYPVPYRLYRSLGFESIARDVCWRRA
jgi:ribosomal protein S18 acetylase RimI-like enzyme